MALTLLQKAPRRPDGGVVGRAPDVLVPRVLRVLDAQQRSKLADLDAKRQAVNKEFAAFLESLGLPATSGVTYLFGKHGEVRARGIHSPRY